MITKIETARELARAHQSAPDAIWNGLRDFTAALAQQGNTITPKGSVLIGNRFYNITTIWVETRPGEKHEYSRT